MQLFMMERQNINLTINQESSRLTKRTIPFDDFVGGLVPPWVGCEVRTKDLPFLLLSQYVIFFPKDLQAFLLPSII